MNPFLLSKRERISLWRDMRDNLINMEELVRLETIAKWFSLAPLGKISIDPESAKHWQDPWTLLNNNDWCSATVAIAMEATLRLVIPESKPIIAWVIDREASIQTMIVIVGNHVLNYDVGHVVALPDIKPDILYSWRFHENSYVPRD